MRTITQRAARIAERLEKENGLRCSCKGPGGVTTRGRNIIRDEVALALHDITTLSRASTRIMAVLEEHFSLAGDCCARPIIDKAHAECVMCGKKWHG